MSWLEKNVLTCEDAKKGNFVEKYVNNFYSLLARLIITLMNYYVNGHIFFIFSEFVNASMTEANQ